MFLTETLDYQNYFRLQKMSKFYLNMYLERQNELSNHIQYKYLCIMYVHDLRTSLDSRPTKEFPHHVINLMIKDL